MHGLHPVCLTSQGVHGRRVLGLPQVPDRKRWRVTLEALLPGPVLLQGTPEPRQGVQLGTGGRQPHGPPRVGPRQARRGGAPRVAKRRRGTLAGNAGAQASPTSWQLAAGSSGHARPHRAPVVGAPAPQLAPPAQGGWAVPTGGTPAAGRRRRRTVSPPTRLSPWRHTRTGRGCAAGMARCRCACPLACHAGTASGGVGVTGPRDRPCGRAPRAHARVERGRVDR
jgi:hypothetical protein